jgi:hypothetical protein
MTKLSEHPSGKFVKLFFIGDSGTGKTGALISLVKAGYELRILDFDVGMAALKNFIMRECPERVDQVDVETCRDSWTNGPTGPKVKGQPKAFTRAVTLLDKWSDGTVAAEWGENTILVLDSLTHYARAAHAFARNMHPDWKDGRLIVGLAQDLIFNQLCTMMADEFHAHVIIIAHIDKSDESKHYVASIGKALGPKLPSIINTMIEARTTGFGEKITRKINTLPTALLDLKNPAPFNIESSYPLETGLATIFAKLRADT